MNDQNGAPITNVWKYPLVNISKFETIYESYLVHPSIVWLNTGLLGLNLHDTNQIIHRNEIIKNIKQFEEKIDSPFNGDIIYQETLNEILFLINNTELDKLISIFLDLEKEIYSLLPNGLKNNRNITNIGIAHSERNSFISIEKLVFLADLLSYDAIAHNNKISVLSIQKQLDVNIKIENESQLIDDYSIGPIRRI